MSKSISGLHDPYEDQLAAARFRAERDMLAQAMERVADDIERTFLGFEGAEDAPAMRWARGLREALGALHSPRTSYEDIEAAQWVRDHGRLDEVRRRWECLSYYADPVPRSCMEKRLARLQRQIDESHAALRRRNARIGFLVSELNRANHENHEEFMRRAGDYTAFTDEVFKRLAPELRYVEGCSKNVMDAALDALDRRLMPEGMEWPRFEDGEPVCIGNEVHVENEKPYPNFDMLLESITINSSGFSLTGADCEYVEFGAGERVKRPAPKVLDAGGAEIRVGDEVWDVDGSGPFVVSGFVGEPLAVVFEIAECNDLPRKPSQLTHRAPVLAADGKPLREGETVWGTGREQHEYVVLGQPGLGGGTGRFKVACHDVTDDCDCDCDPSLLTHERPVADTWERIEEDKGLNPFDYCKKVGHKLWTFDNAEKFKTSDLVRRCRALAERERGE